MKKGSLSYEMMDLAGHWWQMWRHQATSCPPVKYHYGTHPSQYLLAFVPPGTAHLDKPLAFFFNGGAWQFGSPEMFRAQARFFLENGFAVILPSYRKLPEHCFLHIRADLTKLLEWTRTWMEQGGWSEPSLVLSGMSAGGHLAAHMALDTAELTKAGLQPRHIKGMLLCGAPLDLTAMPDNLILRRLAGPRDGDLFVQSNPVNLLTPDTSTPILCLHGDHDGLVPLESACLFIQKAHEITRSDIHFEIIPHGTHLDAGRWSYKRDGYRELIVGWLGDKESLALMSST